MFKIDSETTLLNTFRPKDRKSVELSRDVTLPVIVHDYLAWVHPSGGRMYLVFAVPGGAPNGIVFDTSGTAGPNVSHMCDWCHSNGSGTQIGLLTAQLNSKKSVGVQICADLTCKQKLQENADRAGVSVTPFIDKLIARMGRFASEALKLDLVGGVP